MRNIWHVAKKEIGEHINSGQFYVISIAFLLITGFFFTEYLFLINRSDMSTIFSVFPFIAMVFLPLLTMGSFSSEVSSGTVELLLTMPIKDNDLILGKMLGNFLTYLMVLGSTIIYPMTIFILGSPDVGQIFAGYLAAILLGLSLISAGLFVSSLTKSSITSFIISFIISFILVYIGHAATFLPGFIGSILNYLSINFHYHGILKGLVSTSSIIYFISFNIFFLLLAKISVESRKW